MKHCLSFEVSEIELLLALAFEEATKREVLSRRRPGARDMSRKLAKILDKAKAIEAGYGKRQFEVIEFPFEG